MNIQTVLLSAAVVTSLFSFSQETHAHGVLAAGVNGVVYVLDTLSNTVTDQNRSEALAGCMSLGGESCKVAYEVEGNNTIAVSRADYGMYFSGRTDPDMAISDSLAGCRKSYKNCRSENLYWIPLHRYAAYAGGIDAEGIRQPFFAYNAGSEPEAEQVALNGCKKNGNLNCVVENQYSKAITYVYAAGNKSAFVSMHASPDSSKQIALEGCKKQHKEQPGSCKVESVFQNEGPSVAPKNFQAAYKKTFAWKQENVRGIATNASTSRQDNRLTCHNQCVNGDCVRTFPGGRQERWQAPRVYDPLSGDWKWETGSCGQ